MILAENLRKTFGPLVAVDSVSFEVPTGQVFGLLGPNGAGKTTTIQMLVGIVRPDGGRVQIAGSTDPTRPEVRRRIGLAPQSLAVYGRLTAAENLAFFGKLYGLRGRALRRRIEWALDFAGLTERRDDRVETYSGGMKRRLNMAAALIHDPAVLIFDEPTVGVDPQSRNRMFDSFETLKTHGRTIIYTTHYIEEAARLCDRVAIIDHGRLLACDTVDRLIAAYGGKSAVTAELARPPRDPNSLPGPLEGSTLRFDTDHPLEDIGRLTAAGVEFVTLRVDRPDLETVFLTLTGRRLRD